MMNMKKSSTTKTPTKVFNSLYSQMFSDQLKFGGSTYSYEGKKTEGFAVGGYTKGNKSHRVDYNDLQENDSYWFKHYVQRVVEEYAHLLQNNYYFVGTWFDKENNQLVIDIVRVFSDKHEALFIAKHREQTHIYDITNSKEIKL